MVKEILELLSLSQNQTRFVRPPIGPVTFWKQFALLRSSAAKDPDMLIGMTWSGVLCHAQWMVNRLFPAVIGVPVYALAMARLSNIQGGI